MELLDFKLDEALQKLECADKDTFRYQQGRVKELRDMLGLEETATAVIEADRNPRKSISIDVFD
jgi:hypothetical protein